MDGPLESKSEMQKNHLGQMQHYEFENEATNAVL